MKSINDFFSVISGNVSLNYNYKDWFDIAIDDLCSSSLLLDNFLYPQAVYFFQQSVEKSCKYLGLTFNIIKENQLFKVGHEPQNIYDFLFNSDIMKVITSNNNWYEQLKNESNEKEPIDYLKTGIQMLDNIEQIEMIKVFIIQMHLSIVVTGVESNTRYPDKKLGTTPNDIYNEQTVLINQLSFFIEKQNHCLDVLNKNFFD